MTQVDYNPAMFTKIGSSRSILKMLLPAFRPVSQKRQREFAEHIGAQLDGATEWVSMPVRLSDLVRGVLGEAWQVRDIAVFKMNIGTCRVISFENEELNNPICVLETYDSDAPLAQQRSPDFAALIAAETLERVKAKLQTQLAELEPAPLTLEALQCACKKLGLIARKDSFAGEYVVTAKHGKSTDREDVAYYTNDLDDAWGTALAMAPKIKEDPRFAPPVS